MPKGTKLVDWTNPGNDTKLLLAILRVQEIKPDNAKIAACFGPDVTAACIQQRLFKLRKMSGEKGLIGTAATGAGAKRSSTGMTALPNKKPKTSGKIKKEDGTENEGGSATIDGTPTIKTTIGGTRLNTPPETPDNAVCSTGAKKSTPTTPTPAPRPTKLALFEQRASSRDKKVIDYAKLNDPGLSGEDATDEEAEKDLDVDGTVDSTPSDQDFSGADDENASGVED